MLCVVYKSPRRADTYLYVAHGKDLTDLPAVLLQSFGTPQQVMILNLQPDRKLAQVNAVELLEHLQDPGYYLQLPPPPENLLDKHRQQGQ